ncbi:putative damage-inducible protein DinB [Gillisia mitskevichiae]|uniref:Putative damage-inducible protein DinB n=1 Tax=Gillisia mitskevichiae TaxID=270921 RepID=A0A495PV71_9FLAO|nr:DinB family protein [Gillisia mitskevichiae]RKS53896.1 putative damage-inducible protein DinB [Gillisia mitskevichiae]
MDIQEILIPELQQEAALTEKFLRRIPQDKMEWRPHKKSMNIRELGNHLAEIPSWITGTMEMDEMNMDDYKPTDIKSVDELVETLRKNASEAEASLKKSDKEYQKNWKMIMNGETVMDMPKIKVLRSMVLNQIPHHRAQLGVYFRLLDIPVPATYGPSADEDL